MNKLLLFSTVLLVLFTLASTQKKIKTQRDHIAEIKPTKKLDIPPHIRKCMNIKCGTDQQCFHGRCIKVDAKCATIRCQQGYRCKNGLCIKQLHQPKKMLCTPLNFKFQKRQCTGELLITCSKQVVSLEVCGFNKKSRKFFDYASPCQACSDKASEIDFYFETSCDAAPRICSQDEECMNGVCTAQFKDPVFQNYRSCNEKIDCKANEECAFHKCVDRKDLFNYLSSKSEEQTILVKI